MAMTNSDKLRDQILPLEKRDDVGDTLYECCDGSSTAGYDNDGSTGTDLFNNGITVGMAAIRYDPNAVVFFAIGDQGTAYYQFGKDEDDALRRLREAVTQHDNS